MIRANLEQERERELLSRAIVDILRSWPEEHRRVFEQAHYQGRSAESISKSLDLSTAHVRLILENCDRRLRSALRGFRGDLEDPESQSCKGRTAFSVNGCYR
jgi:DNA-directed RNA polymerase specialized sigma24 family protein